MNCTFTNQSTPSSAQSARDDSTSSGSSAVSKYMASPARTASRVLAWPTRNRPSRQIASTVCSLPFR